MGSNADAFCLSHLLILKELRRGARHYCRALFVAKLWNERQSHRRGAEDAEKKRYLETEHGLMFVDCKNRPQTQLLLASNEHTVTRLAAKIEFLK